MFVSNQLKSKKLLSALTSYLVLTHQAIGLSYVKHLSQVKNRVALDQARDILCSCLKKQPLMVEDLLLDFIKSNNEGLIRLTLHCLPFISVWAKSKKNPNKLMSSKLMQYLVKNLAQAQFSRDIFKQEFKCWFNSGDYKITQDIIAVLSFYSNNQACRQLLLFCCKIVNTLHV